MTKHLLMVFLFHAVIGCGAASAQDDIADMRDKTFRLEADRKLRYKLIAAQELGERPADGYKVLVVLPGGDGGADFTPFIKRIFKHALSDDYLVIQLIAPKWSSKQEIVWPTVASPTRGMKVPTEAFVKLAVDDVASRTTIDRERVYSLAWSSGGPAAYAASMSEDTPVTGTLAAMSVFRFKELPLDRAKNQAYYLLHSEADQVCPFWMARKAAEVLPQHGAKLKLVTYDGGHGWRGDVFGNIAAGVEWLEANSAR